MKKLCILSLLILLSSCGVESSPENYDLENLGEIVLTSSNHPHGYGQDQCFACHHITNIHKVDRLGGDLELARSMVDSQGIQSCSVCHGDNGVPSP